MPTIAVAGISGYTGLRLLPHLRADARLLVRPSTARKSPWREDPRTVAVDLLDEDALARELGRPADDNGAVASRTAAANAVDVIVCLVGTTRAQFRPASEGEHAVNYDTVDIGIPRALANAGKRARVRKMVLLTSYGISTPGAYPAAKRAAEEAVRASGLTAVFVRPSFIAGPGRASPKAFDILLAPVRLVARGFADDMRSIDVEVLARAIFRAATSSEWDGQVLSGRVLHRIGSAP